MRVCVWGVRNVLNRTNYHSHKNYSESLNAQEQCERYEQTTQRIVATLKCEHLRWRFEMDWILNGHFIWYLVARRFQHSTVENEEMYVWHGSARHGSSISLSSLLLLLPLPVVVVVVAAVVAAVYDRFTHSLRVAHSPSLHIVRKLLFLLLNVCTPCM